MSRIVVLVGSVRREGNTELLAKAFAEGAGKRHEVEHFAWPGEAKEIRRLFWLRKREDD